MSEGLVGALNGKRWIILRHRLDDEPACADAGAAHLLGCKEKYRSSTQEKTRRCGYKPEKNSGLLKVVGAHATIAKKAPAAKPAASATSAVK